MRVCVCALLTPPLGTCESMQVAAGEKRLCVVSDASGNLTMKEVATGDMIRRSLLSSKDVYILGYPSPLSFYELHKTLECANVHSYTRSSMQATSVRALAW